MSWSEGRGRTRDEDPTHVSFADLFREPIHPHTPESALFHGLPEQVRQRHYRKQGRMPERTYPSRTRKYSLNARNRW